MKEIKAINKNSLAKIMALIYGLAGFFMALIVALSTMANIILKKDFSGSVVLVTLFNIGAGLLLGVLASLITALIGWLIGYITAAVYNWFASKAGGIKVKLVEAVENKKGEGSNQRNDKFPMTNVKSMPND